MAQLVKHPTSAQVMTSQSVSSSPLLGSVLTAQSLKPVSDSVSPFLSSPPHIRGSVLWVRTQVSGASRNTVAKKSLGVMTLLARILPGFIQNALLMSQFVF